MRLTFGQIHRRGQSTLLAEPMVGLPREFIDGTSSKKFCGHPSERADTDPKVFTKIHMHFTVTGSNIPASAVERAIAMSHEKYCSASIMLGKTAEMTTSFEVTEA